MHHPIRDLHHTWVPALVALAAITIAGLSGFVTP